MLSNKVYCGGGGPDHQCGTVIQAETIVVRAEKTLPASAQGDEFKQTRVISAYFLPDDVPPDWTVVAGPGTYADLSF